MIQQKNEKEVITGHILAFFTIIIWGSTFIASKVLLDFFTPSQLMFFRFIIAYVTLCLVKPKFEKIKIKDELEYFLLSLFGCTLYFLSENTALTYTLTSNVSIIVASAPIITSILAHFFAKGERFHKNIFYGFVVSFLGVALVVFNGTVILKFNPLGDLLSLGAALSWSIYCIMLNNKLKTSDNIILTRKVMFYGIVTSLPFVVFQNSPINIEAFQRTDVLFCFLFLGIIGSGICYVTWNMATKKIGVVKTGNYIYLNPFITMITASLFLREHISVMAIIGALLILSGIFITNFKKN